MSPTVALDPRGDSWTEDEIGRLIEWGKAAKHPPYELLAEQFPGRSPQALRNKLHRLRRDGQL